MTDKCSCESTSISDVEKVHLPLQRALREITSGITAIGEAMGDHSYRASVDIALAEARLHRALAALAAARTLADARGGDGEPGIAGKRYPSQGIYPKYKIYRTDGEDAPGRKHADCDLFVLDLSHDPIARLAALTYANEAADRGLSVLSTDLLAVVHRHEKNPEVSQ